MIGDLRISVSTCSIRGNCPNEPHLPPHLGRDLTPQGEPYGSGREKANMYLLLWKSTIFFSFIHIMNFEHWVWSPNIMHHSHLTSFRDKTTTTARLNRTHELLDNSRPTGLTYAAYIRLSQKSSASHMWRRGEKRNREMELTSNDLEMECFRWPSPWLPSSVFSLSQGTQWSGLENLAASQ